MKPKYPISTRDAFIISFAFIFFYLLCCKVFEHYISLKQKSQGFILQIIDLNMRCATRMSRGGYHLGKLYIFSMLFEQFRYALSANLFNRDYLVTWLFADTIADSINHPDTNSKSLTGYDILSQALWAVLLSHSSSSLETNCKLIYFPLAPITKAVLPA